MVAHREPVRLSPSLPDPNRLQSTITAQPFVLFPRPVPHPSSFRFRSSFLISLNSSNLNLISLKIK